MTGDHAWTIAEALAYFTDGGAPIDEQRLRLLIRAHKLRPVAETPSSERGGRGYARYRITDLMELHKQLLSWDAQHPQQERPQTPSGDSS